MDSNKTIATYEKLRTAYSHVHKSYKQLSKTVVTHSFCAMCSYEKIVSDMGGDLGGGKISLNGCGEGTDPCICPLNRLAKRHVHTLHEHTARGYNEKNSHKL
jgi:hypothetical protein